ncbi:hypothetical protein HFV04_018175 [Pseudomonas sp. BIGb0427]|uniref:hypothetical protein n=1 Tax=unclassified Pseudomonas TaxID=196821 RepID=UPI0008882611|nr:MULTISPECIES: hypothetical protein [unclassified Pseudomonas]QPG61443.1 hypothetical protein HFV04_018175 [Pseudomonas sp. BIGb0427]UVM58036.1 hypothetical protein LOY37_10825 [Pseudomonas sp. B21-012]UVM68959.1 hypothetical protein LOY34_10675 [Pseudomonas sp. B21-009]SDQ78818.1 hypothetical protein SAMN05216487_3892 [Pseudomonas sp. UC 17F4]
MRAYGLTLAAFFLLALPLGAQAKALGNNDRYMCSWGSQIAAGAQQSKLSGVTLYAARKRLQVRKFNKPWMRMTAMGITEQTYNSQSRLKPAAIKQTYYEQCVSHALARR